TARAPPADRRRGGGVPQTPAASVLSAGAVQDQGGADRTDRGEFLHRAVPHALALGLGRHAPRAGRTPAHPPIGRTRGRPVRAATKMPGRSPPRAAPHARTPPAWRNRARRPRRPPRARTGTQDPARWGWWRSRR